MKEMRRKKQAMSEDEIINILSTSSSGVLALIGEDNYTYQVPLNFLYKDGYIYFHCANEGYKLDLINRNEKCSFCIISQDDVIPEKLATNYRSVFVMGKIEIIANEDLKIQAIRDFSNKFASHLPNLIEKEIELEKDHLTILKMKVEYVSGKKALGLLK